MLRSMARSPTPEELLAAGRVAEAGHLYEMAGRGDKAADCFGRVGLWAEAARGLTQDGRHTLAAEAWPRLLPDLPTSATRLSMEARRAAVQAAASFGRGGDPIRAAHLLINLGERDRAADVLQRAGKRPEAVRVQRGEPLPGNPLPSGQLSSGSAGPAAGKSEADPLRSAERLQAVGRIGDALNELARIPSTDPRYRAAVHKAVPWMADKGTLDFAVDRWLSPFVRAQGVHQAPDLPVLYALGRLYEDNDFTEGAESVWRAILAVDSTFWDVPRRLAALARDQRGGAEVFERILHEERSFLAADGRRRFGPVAGEPDPMSLPELPDLPPLGGPSAFDLGPPPPQTPHRMTSVPTARIPESPTMTGVRRPMSRPDQPAWASRPAAPVPEPPTRNYQAEVVPPRAAPAVDVDISAVMQGAVIAERYLIERKIGEGGMAAVYKATDLVLEDVVALKLFRLASQDTAGAERFKQEMKICRRLNHPNVVRTYEFGVWGEAYFITMEYLAGKDLDGVLREQRGPLPNHRGLELMIQAADGLQAAHDEGIAHRDVKPQNMFVVGERLKIMDFGIARAMEGGVSVTQAGMVVGTPAYLSPERLEGSAGDGRSSDIYALGIVMYQVWTGVLPFRGPDITAMFMQHLTAAPEAPSRRNPGIPRAIERVILQLLEKQPEARYPTAAAVRDALVAARASLPRG